MILRAKHIISLSLIILLPVLAGGITGAIDFGEDNFIFTIGENHIVVVSSGGNNTEEMGSLRQAPLSLPELSEFIEPDDRINQLINPPAIAKSVLKDKKEREICRSICFHMTTSILSEYCLMCYTFISKQNVCKTNCNIYGGSISILHNRVVEKSLNYASFSNHGNQGTNLAANTCICRIKQISKKLLTKTWQRIKGGVR